MKLKDLFEVLPNMQIICIHGMNFLPITEGLAEYIKRNALYNQPHILNSKIGLIYTDNEDDCDKIHVVISKIGRRKTNETNK